jgi:hypothetical protein
MSFARQAMQLETALRLPALAMRFSKGGEDAGVACREGPGAHREFHAGDQRQDAAHDPRDGLSRRAFLLEMSAPPACQPEGSAAIQGSTAADGTA